MSMNLNVIFAHAISDLKARGFSVDSTHRCSLVVSSGSAKVWVELTSTGLVTISEPGNRAPHFCDLVCEAFGLQQGKRTRQLRTIKESRWESIKAFFTC